MTSINPEAEKYISILLAKETPYERTIFNTKFLIPDTNVYPPGRLTEMFIEYLVENNLIQQKIVADIGIGCFALGIMAAKNGAKIVIGTGSEESIRCAKENLALNKITTPVYLFKGEGPSPLLPAFEGQVDLIVSGIPWDSITKEEFEKIPLERQPMSQAFYDIDDKFIHDLMGKGFELLSRPDNKLFLTSSMRTIGRDKDFCQKYRLNYKIVKEKDIHNDGNLHYILEIIRA